MSKKLHHIVLIQFKETISLKEFKRIEMGQLLSEKLQELTILSFGKMYRPKS